MWKSRGELQPRTWGFDCLRVVGLKLGAFSLGRGAGGKFGKEFVDRTTLVHTQSKTNN